MNADLTGLRVAVLAADGFEQVEVTSPVEALRDHGAEVEIVSLHPGRIRGVNFLYPGKKVRVDRTLFTADAEDYDALLIPGGLVGPDTLRQSERALDFVRATERAGKPIAVICHGPWLLVSAGLMVRRNVTSWPGIRDDVRNAGGIWHDEPVVRDRNWVSSRGPHDLRRFNRAMVELFAEHVPAAPRRPAYGERREEGGGFPLGKLLGGALLAGVAGYALKELLEGDGGRPVEFVEVVDTEPGGAHVAAAVREGTARHTATATGGAHTGGGGLAPRVE
jgi:protease I